MQILTTEIQHDTYLSSILIVNVCSACLDFHYSRKQSPTAQLSIDTSISGLFVQQFWYHPLYCQYSLCSSLFSLVIK